MLKLVTNVERLGRKGKDEMAVTALFAISMNVLNLFYSLLIMDALSSGNCQQCLLPDDISHRFF